MGDLEELQQRAYASSMGWFPALHERGHLAVRLHYAIGLNEEAGEVAGVVKKANLCGGLMDECGLHAPGKHSRQALSDEMADVLMYLCSFAAHENIDLLAAIASKGGELNERWGVMPVTAPHPDAVRLETLREMWRALNNDQDGYQFNKLELVTQFEAVLMAGGDN